MGWEDNLIVNVLAEFDPHTHVRCGGMFLQSGCLRGRDNQLLGVHWAAGLATGKVKGRDNLPSPQGECHQRKVTLFMPASV